jgi:hypothetical protein
MRMVATSGAPARAACRIGDRPAGRRLYAAGGGFTDGCVQQQRQVAYRCGAPAARAPVAAVRWRHAAAPPRPHVQVCNERWADRPTKPALAALLAAVAPWSRRRLVAVACYGSAWEWEDGHGTGPHREQPQVGGGGVVGSVAALVSHQRFPPPFPPPPPAPPAAAAFPGRPLCPCCCRCGRGRGRECSCAASRSAPGRRISCRTTTTTTTTTTTATTAATTTTIIGNQQSQSNDGSCRTCTRPLPTAHSPLPLPLPTCTCTSHAPSCCGCTSPALRHSATALRHPTLPPPTALCHS